MAVVRRAITNAATFPFLLLDDALLVFDTQAVYTRAKSIFNKALRTLDWITSALRFSVSVSALTLMYCSYWLIVKTQELVATGISSCVTMFINKLTSIRNFHHQFDIITNVEQFWTKLAERRRFKVWIKKGKPSASIIVDDFYTYLRECVKFSTEEELRELLIHNLEHLNLRAWHTCHKLGRQGKDDSTLNGNSNEELIGAAYPVLNSKFSGL
ncbi:hypothetical protein E4T47_00851 [Aureobasidium subglaciale]|nr:hypothetical protein E4T47_00851 [Aureobasidium subglaciale]